MSLKDFTLMQKLGQGSYAKVYKALRQTDKKLYAIKQIDISRLDEKAKQNALNQIRFLASFDCKNIVKYYEAFFEEELGLLCIVMEFANEGDLGGLILRKKENGEKFFEIQIWKALIGLLHGIGYLHDRSILHRDVKPENIFLYNGNVKLGDLNVSKLTENMKQKLTQIGTPFYASPQIWQNHPYDNKCDVWSLGCVLYQMATLNPPFLGKSMDKLYDEVTKGKIKPIPKHFSNELASIINRCLEKDPSKRPSIKELQENFTVKMYENLYYSSQELEMEKSKYAPLLKTIAIGKDKSMAKLELPESNYKDEREPEQTVILKEIPKNEEKSVQATPKKELNPQLECRRSENRKRSLPRTELSSKKLQTVDQVSQNSQQKPKVSQPTLLSNNNENIYDYKNVLCCKLQRIQSSLVTKVNAPKGKKSIIQELVQHQQVNLKRRQRLKDERLSRDYCRIEKQVKEKPKIFIRQELELLAKNNFVRGIRGAQSSLNL